jgi:hydroxyacylglutathione hydrolase
MNYQKIELENLSVTLIPACMQNYIYLLTWSGGAAVVDPGDAEPVLEVLRAESIKPGWIIATHFHGDHVAGIPPLKQATGAQVIGPGGGGRSEVDVGVREGDTALVGPLEFQVLETPGHTLRDTSFYCADHGILFCGDTLFACGCGRLFEGSPADMWSSLRKLRELPDETLVFCGHEYTLDNLDFAMSIDPDNPALKKRQQQAKALRGEGKPTIPSTIREEKQTNPFMRSDCADLKAALGLGKADDVQVLAEIRSRKDRF